MDPTNATSITVDIPPGLVPILNIKFMQGFFMVISGILMMCDSIGEIFLQATAFVLHDILGAGPPPEWIAGLIDVSLLAVIGYLTLGISRKMIKYSALIFIGLVVVCILISVLGGS